MTPYRQVPGPRGMPLVGSLFAYARDPLGFLSATATVYGAISQFKVGPAHVYVLNHPDYIYEVLVAQRDRFVKERTDIKILARFLGRGLLTSEDPFHKRQRKLVQPAFHIHRIQSYAQTMVHHTDSMMQEWRSGETRRIDYDMTKLTLRIVAKTLFNVDVGTTSDGVVERVNAALTELLDIAIQQIKRGIAVPEWLPLAINTRHQRAKAVLDALVLEIIRERRASREDRGDLLSMLLLAQDDADGTGMTDEHVRDEVMTLFLAGHETTANALTWTWYVLSQHPDVATSLVAELDRVLGGRLPTCADLPSLAYAAMVIKESMRLYPPAWSLNGRQALNDIIIDGYRIAQGSTVIISPYVMHRNPQYFPNPERFDPDRFLPEHEEQRAKFAYLPFGGGERVCIGNSFAMMEACLILATIAQQYRVQLDPKQIVEPEPLITLRPKHGMRMHVYQRTPVLGA